MPRSEAGTTRTVRLAAIPVVGIVLMGLLALSGDRGDRPAAIHVVPPPPAELDALAGLTVFFGHQSVGMNVIDGIGQLYAEAGRAAPAIVETRATAGAGPVLAHAFVGVNGDPYGKLADFDAVLSGPSAVAVDVAVLKFCYADIVAETDVAAVFDAYVSGMESLEKRNPDVRFLYATVPLTADRSLRSKLKAAVGRDDRMGPADNAARQRYNELVRDRYGATGRLFDIAAVEATLQQSPARRSRQGRTYYVLNDALRTDRGHLNATGSRLAAAEFVRVVAGSGA